MRRAQNKTAPELLPARFRASPAPAKAKHQAYFGYGEPKMVEFENRRAAYLKVREHRKRKTTPFAGRQSSNLR